jgi:hypothetical protein
MSVDTATTPVDENIVTSETPQENTLPIIPDNDEDVSTNAQRMDRISDLLTVARETPDSSDVLTERALTLAVATLSRNAGPEHSDRVLMHYRDDVDPETGEGRSQRFHYPRERAAILQTIATAFGVKSVLTHRVYEYAGKRKQYSVRLFGAEQDVARVIKINSQLDQIVLARLARMEFAPNVNPGQQTQLKRKNVAAYALDLSEKLTKLLAQNENAQRVAESRRNKFASARFDETKEEWITAS